MEGEGCGRWKEEDVGDGRRGVWEMGGGVANFGTIPLSLRHKHGYCNVMGKKLHISIITIPPFNLLHALWFINVEFCWQNNYLFCINTTLPFSQCFIVQEYDSSQVKHCNRISPFNIK